MLWEAVSRKKQKQTPRLLIYSNTRLTRRRIVGMSNSGSNLAEHTMTGKITSYILVAQHLRATFCTNEWLMEHVDSLINEMVVMYQSVEQVIRPPAPTDVPVCKGIMLCFSFLFLGVPRNYAKRPFSCWCKTCSRVRGGGRGSQSSGSDLLVRSK
jgi:hypothetical protein